MAAIQLEGQRATPGDPHDVGTFEADSSEEASEAIGVIGEPVVIGRIR
jgi:hypothetical protein